MILHEISNLFSCCVRIRKSSFEACTGRRCLFLLEYGSVDLIHAAWLLEIITFFDFLKTTKIELRTFCSPGTFFRSRFTTVFFYSVQLIRHDSEEKLTYLPERQFFLNSSEWVENNSRFSGKHQPEGSTNKTTRRCTTTTTCMYHISNTCFAYFVFRLHLFKSWGKVSSVKTQLEL